MKHYSRVLLFVCTVVVAATWNSGCATLLGGKPQQLVDSVSGDSIPRFVELQVDNHNWSDVVVYVVHSGLRTRLGTAGTARSTPFRFPLSYAFANNVSLLVTPIGSPTRFESERFSVLAGQRVFWTIESSLVRSSLLVR